MCVFEFPILKTMCLRTTLAFLLSASALSLLWRERDLVCSTSNFCSNLATRPLMYSESV